MSDRWRVFTLARDGAFRRYGSLQVLSGATSSAQMLVEMWLIYLLTSSSFSVGVGIALRAAPAIVLMPLAGKAADRFSRNVLFVATQSTRCVLLVIFAVHVHRGLPELWEVLAFAGVMGSVQAVDRPLRQAIVRDVVTAADLPAAASLHSATVGGGAILGSVACGLLVAVAPWSSVFAFAACTSAVSLGVAVSLSLGARRSLPDTRRADHLAANTSHSDPAASERRLTVRYVAAVSIFGMNAAVLLPLMAVDTAGGSASAYAVLHGSLRAASVVGSLVGAFTIASMGVTPRHVATAGALCGGAFLALSAAQDWRAVLAGFAVVGICAGFFLSRSHAAAQTMAMPRRQGHQVAVFSTVAVAGRTAGAPLVGFIADIAGPRAAAASAGGAAIVAVAVLHSASVFRERRRRHREPIVAVEGTPHRGRAVRPPPTR